MAEFLTYYGMRFNATYANQVIGCLMTIANRIALSQAIAGFTPPGNAMNWANKIMINDQFLIDEAKRCIPAIAANSAIATKIELSQQPLDTDIEWTIINQVTLSNLISTSGA